MKRKNLLRKTKKGFTLVELIVAIAIFAIFSAGAAAILVPVLNIYGAAIELSDAQLVASDILGAVQNELAYAQPGKKPQISADGSFIEFDGKYPDTRITTSSAGGNKAGYLYIARNAEEEFQPYYDERYYRNDKVEVAFAVHAGSNALTVTVKVKDKEDEVIYTAAGSVTPLASV